jgi:hypothetical protein
MGFFGGGGGSAASNMVGATSSTAGVAGLVPAPAAGDQRTFLRGDATFQSISGNLIPISASRRSGGITFACGSSDLSGRGTANGFVLFAPIYIRQTKAYTTFSVYVTVAGTASSVGKIALYSINSSAAPDQLICESGTFATDSIGVKQPTMASTIVNDGWYYAALATNSAASVTFYACSFVEIRAFISGSVSGSTPILLDYSTKTYASLWPSTWSGTDNYSGAYHFICELT